MLPLQGLPPHWGGPVVQRPAACWPPMCPLTPPVQPLAPVASLPALPEQSLAPPEQLPLASVQCGALPVQALASSWQPPPVHPLTPPVHQPAAVA